MSATTFRNPHGLPDSRQVTTARDMATLGRALHDRFPQYYHYFSTPSFTWHGVTTAITTTFSASCRRRRHQDRLHPCLRLQSRHLLSSATDRYVVGVVMGGDTLRGARQTTCATSSPTICRAPRTGRAPRRWWWRARSTSSRFHCRGSIRQRTDPIMTAGVSAAGAAASRDQPAEGDSDPTQPPPRDAVAAGWAIQIGALPSRGRPPRPALAKPAAAQTPAFPACRLTPRRRRQWQRVLYRARFVGFASADAAHRGLHQIERHGIDCYVPSL